MSAESSKIRIDQRIQLLARQHPDQTAVITVGPGGEESRSWCDLDRGSDAASRILAERGVGPGSLVGVRLSMSVDHIIATLAAWKLGATVLPLDPKATDAEFRALLSTARPDLVIMDGGHPDVVTVPVAALYPAEDSGGPLPARGVPRSAHATGGSTGRPRIILRRPDWMYPADGFPSAADRAIGLDVGQVQLVMVPLHHAGFTKLFHGLALDHTIVLMPQFVPIKVPALIERHRVNFFVIVPSMMRRLLEVPALAQVNVSSVTAVHQASAGAPKELKQAWMKIFPPETLYEGYSSQERIGALWIRGDEWLEHPGSVGQPVDCAVRIYAGDGRLLRPGEVGEVFLKSPDTRQPTYIGGGPPLAERDGYLSLGDAGFLDDDGYLHIVGRCVEMINVDGVKVYPAEVEEVLLNHSAVRDAAVTARPHDALGQAVHAVVVPYDRGRRPSPAELRQHCRDKLSLAKVPLSYEFRSEIPRSDAGKLRRSSLLNSA
jgi:bile acid-coenzyme A ligase